MSSHRGRRDVEHLTRIARYISSRPPDLLRVRVYATGIESPGLHCAPIRGPEWFNLGNEVDHLATARSGLRFRVGELCFYGEDNSIPGASDAPRKKSAGMGLIIF